MGRWGVHYLKTYREWRKLAALHMPEGDSPQFTGPVAVLTEFIVRKAKTTKRTYPRGDNDNYEKAAWDAITKCVCVWKDDDQILINLSTKRYVTPEEEPHTVVHITAL